MTDPLTEHLRRNVCKALDEILCGGQDKVPIGYVRGPHWCLLTEVARYEARISLRSPDGWSSGRNVSAPLTDLDSPEKRRRWEAAWADEILSAMDDSFKTWLLFLEAAGCPDPVGALRGRVCKVAVEDVHGS